MNSTLQGIDLTDSCVLGWDHQGDTLEFRMDFSLWPESQYYREPKPNEWTCYRRGRLRFDHVTKIQGLKSLTDIKWASDASGERDAGNIDYFDEKQGTIQMGGEFGDVVVKCSSLSVIIDD